jgi:hypothetical protein
MKRVMRFSEFLKLGESRADSMFYSFTGKGFVDGKYVGNPCRWRDNQKLYAGFGHPTVIDLPSVPVKLSKDYVRKACAEKAKSIRHVSVPGFETVVVGLLGLSHGVRLFSAGATAGKAELLNFAAAMAAEDVLSGSVPREFRPADDSNKGKPVKGIVVLEGACRGQDGVERPVRSTVTVSAVCDFRLESGCEQREIYTLHSMNVLQPGSDVLDF